jgi:hypothetical protein
MPPHWAHRISLSRFFFSTLGVHQVIPTYTWIAYNSIILGYAKANVVYPTLDFDISIYENTLYLTLDDLGIPGDKRSARTHFWRSLFYGGLRLKLDQHVTLILSRQVVQYVFCFFFFLQYIYIYVCDMCASPPFPKKTFFFSQVTSEFAKFILVRSSIKVPYTWRLDSIHIGSVKIMVTPLNRQFLW